MASSARSTLSNPEHVFPVSDQLRQYLIFKCGIEPKTTMYYNRSQPHKIYIAQNGSFRKLDLDDFLTRENQADLFGPQDSISDAQVSKNLLQSVQALPRATYSEWHTLSDVERGMFLKERRKANAYKTSMCQTMKESGICEFGEECRFAHNESELRLPPQAHPKYKTQLCNKFAINGSCPYGSRCQFIHQRPTDSSVPTLDGVINRILSPSPAAHMSIASQGGFENVVFKSNARSRLVVNKQRTVINAGRLII